MRSVATYISADGWTNASTVLVSFVSTTHERSDVAANFRSDARANGADAYANYPRSDNPRADDLLANDLLANDIVSDDKITN